MMSPITDPVQTIDEFAVVYVAVDFKIRKGGLNSAGMSIFWGDGHSLTETHPLRGDKLTFAQAQLTGNLFYLDKNRQTD